MGTEEIEKMLRDHEHRIASLEKMLLVSDEDDISTSFSKKISIKEFLIEKAPKSDVQKTLCIGYFLEKYDGLASFNLSDIEDGFRKSKEVVPGNINDKVNKSIRQGHMMEAKEKKDSKKAWSLTRTGETEVENNFRK
jgi:hypothetical protein